MGVYEIKDPDCGSMVRTMLDQAIIDSILYNEPCSHFMPKFKLPKIKRVIFSDPATIVFWEDGTKTVVKKQHEDKKKKFDKEKGLAMAIAKKALGNSGSYFDEFRKWCE